MMHPKIMSRIPFVMVWTSTCCLMALPVASPTSPPNSTNPPTMKTPTPTNLKHPPCSSNRSFALFFTNFSTFLAKPGLYLEDLYVREPFRRQGIGKALITTLARIAIDRDYGRFEWSVLDWNTPAIGFYDRLRALAMDDWTTRRLTDDALEALAQ